MHLPRGPGAGAIALLSSSFVFRNFNVLEVIVSRGVRPERSTPPCSACLTTALDLECDGRFILKSKQTAFLLKVQRGGMRGASQTSVCHTATACLYITATLTLCQLYMFTGFNSSAKDPFSILLVSDDLVRSPYCKWGNESDPGKMFAERLQKTTAHDIIKLVADLNTLECSHDMVESAKVEVSAFWWIIKPSSCYPCFSCGWLTPPFYIFVFV